MAVFVLGAGATRGASFVDPRKHVCVPPLDTDFFTQLQRVQNPKHRELIAQVMEDVVDLFGSNFDASMETVFATLEHTIRMLKTTGEKRDLSIADLQTKRDRLVQSIAVALEDSITKTGSGGSSSRTPRECETHRKFVEALLRNRDSIISFNYDCVMDQSLARWGARKWNPRYGYCFDLGSRGSRLTGDVHWSPQLAASRERTVRLLKLHGSLNFRVTGSEGRESVHLKERPYTRQNGDLRFTIIPPESNKAYERSIFGTLWAKASEALRKTKEIIVIGYSLPATDLHATALFRTSVRRAGLRSVVVVNPDRAARRRVRSVLQRGLGTSTRVLSFDYFNEFVSAARSSWSSDA